jgi:hypothetical protein
MTDAQAYKLLYENNLQANEKILQTVYWSIGSIFFVLLALVGANWWTSHKGYKQDIENIAKETRAQMESIERQHSETIQNRINDINQEIRDELVKHKDSLALIITPQIEGLRNHINDNIKALTDKMAKTDKNITEWVKKEMIKQQEQILNMKIDLLEKEAKDAEKVPIVSLNYYLDALEIAIKIQNDYQIASLLKEVAGTLQQVDELDDYVSPERINNTIDKLAEKYRTEKDVIRDLCRKKYR